MKKILSIILTAFLLVGMVGCADVGDAAPATTESAATETDTADEAGDEAATEEATGDDVIVNEDGSIDNPEAVEVAEGTLSYWNLFGGGDGIYMTEIVDFYNGNSPTMPVQSIQLVWGDYYTKLQTAVAADKGPDIGVSHASTLAQLVDQGVLQPMDDILAELGVDLTDSFSQGSIDSVTFDGQVYAIPLDTHGEIMYFNTDILAEAGVALNDAGTLDISSTDDLLAMFDQVADFIPEGGSVLSFPNQGDDPYRIWWAVYFQMGGTPLVSEDGTQNTMDPAIAQAAAEFVKSLYTEGYIIPGIENHQGFFQQGDAAFSFGGTWATGQYEIAEGLNFGAMSFPQLYDNASCWADAHTFTLPTSGTRTAEESKAAVEFMLAASGDAGGAIWAKSGQVPSNTNVIESEEFLALDYRSDYTSILDTAVLPSKLTGFSGMKSDLIEALNSYWIDAADITTTVDNLVNAVESNLS